MDLDHELTRLLEESVDGLTPPVHTIVAEAGRRGRGLRRLRRLRIAGAVAAVAVVATTGTLLGLRPTHGSAVAGLSTITNASTAGPPSGSQTPLPTPSAPPSTKPTVGPDGLVPATDAALLRLLADRLPAEEKLANYRPVEYGSADNLGFTVDLVDPSGAVTVMVNMYRLDAYASPSCTGPGNGLTRPPGADPRSCDIQNLADGSTQMTDVTPASLTGEYSYQVTTDRNRTRVIVTVWNGVLEIDGNDRGATSTRQKPPFGIAAWRSVATGATWGFRVPGDLADRGDVLAATLR